MGISEQDMSEAYACRGEVIVSSPIDTECKQGAVRRGVRTKAGDQGSGQCYG